MVLNLAEMELYWHLKWFCRPFQRIGMNVEDYHAQFCDWKEEIVSLSFPAEEQDYIDGFIENLSWVIRSRLSKYRSSRSSLINAFYNAKFEESMMYIEENLKEIKANRETEELTVEEQMVQQPIEEQEVESPLSTTSFEDPKSAMKTENPAVGVMGITHSNDEEFESATATYNSIAEGLEVNNLLDSEEEMSKKVVDGQGDSENEALKMFDKSTEPIFTGTKAARNMFDEMPGQIPNEFQDTEAHGSKAEESQVNLKSNEQSLKTLEPWSDSKIKNAQKEGDPIDKAKKDEHSEEEKLMDMEIIFPMASQVIGSPTLYDPFTYLYVQNNQKSCPTEFELHLADLCSRKGISLANGYRKDDIMFLFDPGGRSCLLRYWSLRYIFLSNWEGRFECAAITSFEGPSLSGTAYSQKVIDLRKEEIERQHTWDVRTMGGGYNIELFDDNLLGQLAGYHVKKVHIYVITNTLDCLTMYGHQNEVGNKSLKLVSMLKFDGPLCEYQMTSRGLQKAYFVQYVVHDVFISSIGHADAGARKFIRRIRRTTQSNEPLHILVEAEKFGAPLLQDREMLEDVPKPVYTWIIEEGWVLPSVSKYWIYIPTIILIGIVQDNLAWKDQLHNVFQGSLSESSRNGLHALTYTERLLYAWLGRNNFGYQNTVLQGVIHKNIHSYDCYKPSQVRTIRCCDIESLKVSLNRKRLHSSVLVFGAKTVQQRITKQLQKLVNDKMIEVISRELLEESDSEVDKKSWVSFVSDNKQFSMAICAHELKTMARVRKTKENPFESVVDTKLQNFVWDPGCRVISFYILEDKDVFKRVGKYVVLMDTTLEMTGLIMMLGCLSGQPFWNPDWDALYASCCISDRLGDTVGALDDTGLIPNALVFSTAELELYI